MPFSFLKLFIFVWRTHNVEIIKSFEYSNLELIFSQLLDFTSPSCLSYHFKYSNVAPVYTAWTMKRWLNIHFIFYIEIHWCNWFSIFHNAIILNDCGRSTSMQVSIQNQVLTLIPSKLQIKILKILRHPVNWRLLQYAWYNVMHTWVFLWFKQQEQFDNGAALLDLEVKVYPTIN